MKREESEKKEKVCKWLVTLHESFNIFDALFFLWFLRFWFIEEESGICVLYLKLDVNEEGGDS